MWRAGSPGRYSRMPQSSDPPRGRGPPARPGRMPPPRCPPTPAARRTNRRVRLLWTSTGRATIPPSTAGGTGPTSTRRGRTPRSAGTPPTMSSARRNATRKKSPPAIRLVANRNRNPLRARAASPSGVGLRDGVRNPDAPPESPLSLTIMPTGGRSSPGREFERGPEVRSRQFDRPPGAPYADLTLRDSGRGGGRSCMVRDKLVLTYQDYLQMPDDRNRRGNLRRGLYVGPAPPPLHQRAVVNLITLLQGYLAQHRGGKLYASPVDVVLSQVDVVQPDLVFVSNDRLHLVTEMSIQGAPDLVVEILSPSTARLGRGRKMDAYAQFGVREYWIADTDARTLEIYRLEGQNLRLTSTSEATALSSAVFPDLTFDLQSLWD